MTEDIYLNATTKDLACLVCQDRASGNHYGVPTCDGCRGFFKRSVRKKAVYTCKNEGRCRVDALRRNQCQACRYKKCLEVKMNPDAVQLQRECRSAKRKIEPDDANDENVQTPVKIQKISPRPLSSPGIDSSINSSETSDHEHDRINLKTEDRPTLLHSREAHPSINPFIGLPPFPRLGFPCRPFFGHELAFPLTRPSLTHSPFLPPPLLRLELLPAFNQCLSPVRGMPCMYFTCSLCLERILQSGSNHLSQRHDHGHELNGPKSQTA